MEDWTLSAGKRSFPLSTIKRASIIERFIVCNIRGGDAPANLYCEMGLCVKYYMNLYEQLLVVRERLENIGAHDDSMDLVEKLLKKSEAAKYDKTNISLIQVLRHMMRMPEVIDNYNIYNDLQELASERDDVDITAREDAAPAAYEDTERRPKPKSFYRARKEKEKKKGN